MSNKHLIYFFTFIFLVTGITNSNASENNIKTVDASGYGNTQQLAIQDALQNALMQVVGAHISSSTLVRNAILIEDKILSYSNGYIDGYDIVSTNRDKELFISNLKVKVKEGKLNKKLVELNLVRVSLNLDKDKIEQSVEAAKFNVNTLEELQETFNEVVVQPILKKQSHSVEFKGFNIYEMLGKPEEKSDKNNVDRKIIEFKLKNIQDESKTVVTLDRYNGINYNSTSQLKKIETIDQKYLVEILYRVSLSDAYYERIKSFLDVATDKKEKGVSLNTSGEYNDTNYIILSKLSHMMGRDIFTNLYRFNERKWAKIRDMGNIKLNPYMEFSLLDADEIPVKKCRHKAVYGVSNAYDDGDNFTVACGISSSNFKKIKNKLRKFWDIGGTFSKYVFIFGITHGKPYNLFNYEDSKILLFFKNDHIDYTAYILIDKKDALLIKDIVIKIDPNP